MTHSRVHTLILMLIIMGDLCGSKFLTLPVRLSNKIFTKFVVNAILCLQFVDIQLISVIQERGTFPKVLAVVW